MRALLSALCCILIGRTIAIDVIRSANSEKEWMINVRRQLHRQPELGFQEFNTSKYIREVLDELKIPYQYPIATTGIVATIGRGSPTVGLRADMDALPVHEPEGLEYRSQNEGLMHACGHDSHMAMLLGAGKLLKAQESQLKGTVKLIFQPAEEGYAGGRTMVEEGVLAGVGAVFGFHNWPTMDTGTVGSRAGTILGGAGQFHITVRGRGGHAAVPHGNVDPVVAAAHLITGLQTLVSRETSPLDSVVVSVTMLRAGDAYNVIPDTAEVAGTFRALKVSTFDRTQQRIEQLVQSMALAYGCTATVDWTNQPIYPPTVNDGEAWSFARGVGESLFGSDNVMDIEPTLAGEDFAFFAQQVPSAMIFLGHRNEAAGSGAALHSPNFRLDENVLAIGAAYHTKLALTYLEQAGRLSGSAAPQQQDEL